MQQLRFDLVEMKVYPREEVFDALKGLEFEKTRMDTPFQTSFIHWPDQIVVQLWWDLVRGGGRPNQLQVAYTEGVLIDWGGRLREEMLKLKFVVGESET